MKLQTVEMVSDFHCVTRWSKRDLRWEGVPTHTILDTANPKPNVVQVMAHRMEGYTANIPMEYFRKEDSLLAFRLGEDLLSPEHGAPIRLVVPKLYAWKSTKYLSGLEFQTDWESGYWEKRGYHLIGDPWKEQRQYHSQLPF
jgi:DMSO/TMAO reductase YedYZ molybdopterin-dependent catalytic subunit